MRSIIEATLLMILIGIMLLLGILGIYKLTHNSPELQCLKYDDGPLVVSEVYAKKYEEFFKDCLVRTYSNTQVHDCAVAADRIAKVYYELDKVKQAELQAKARSSHRK